MLPTTHCSRQWDWILTDTPPLPWITHFHEGRQVINKHIMEWGHKQREEKQGEAWGHEGGLWSVMHRLPGAAWR